MEMATSPGFQAHRIVKTEPVELVETRKLIGEILENLGLVTQAQIEEGLRVQRKTGERLGQTLVKLGYITNGDVCRGLATQFGLEPIKLSDKDVPPKVIAKVTPELARRHRMVPFKEEDGTLVVAIADPLNLFAIDNLKLFLGCDVKAVLTTEDEITQALEKYYGPEEATVDRMIRELAEADSSSLKKEYVSSIGTKATEDEAPIIKLVSLLILEAFNERASDIHIEPLEDKLRVRYRIDGVLHEVPGPPKRLQGSITSRIKIMAKLDIAEKRLPQDGRIRFALRGKDIDLRVSTIPSLYGESVVLRILDKSSLLMGLDKLGFSAFDKARFERLINIPNGIVLVTGPTGSGKTTTLYSALSSINKPDRKLITVEDPVEYQLPGINQVQVKPQIGLTFANSLRAMLRQSPDIIMVGEIRDLETAEIATRVALTGHLVFSTLHTNDATGAITRLIDMGIAPYLVASSLQGVVAQRLIRTICDSCKEEYIPKEEEKVSLNIGAKDMEGITFYKGKGCQECGQTGYKGRIGIFEILIITDEIKELIFTKATDSAIKAKAHELGMKTLREDGKRKVSEGIITIDEVIRVTQAEI